MSTPELGWINYRLRPIEPRDNDAYARLVAIHMADRPFSIQETIKADLHQQATAHQMGQLVVAETPDGQVVGSGSCDIVPIWLEGQPVVGAYLQSTLIHPAFRQRGVTTAITQWRISWARRHYGVNLVIFSEISQDTIASYKNALKWATDLGQPRESGFLSTTWQRPIIPPELVIREATPVDCAPIVAGINQFNEDVNFTQFVTDPGNGDALARQFVVERDGEILGGAVLTLPGRVARLSAPSPSPLKVVLAYLIIAVNVTYHKGRAARVDNFWFRRGQTAAAHHLIENLRFRAHREASCLYMTVTNPAVWDAIRPLYWETERSSSIAYYRPQRLRPFLDHL